MSTEHKSNFRQRSYLVHGLSLIGVGAFFLLYQQDLLELHQFWDLLAGVYLLHALNALFDCTLASLLAGGAKALIGLWILSLQHDLLGVTLMQTWPILLIAMGLERLADHFAGLHMARHLSGSAH